MVHLKIYEPWNANRMFQQQQKATRQARNEGEAKHEKLEKEEEKTIKWINFENWWLILVWVCVASDLIRCFAYKTFYKQIRRRDYVAASLVGEAFSEYFK